MARRSDFAQKLLDDIRIRKEKMGIVAPSSQQSTQLLSADVKYSSEAYGRSLQCFQSPGEATTSKFNGKSTTQTEITKLWLGTSHYRTAAHQGASQDIVPVGRARNIGHTVDVSMALALALSNSGELQNMELFSNVVLGNKLILHSGSIQLRELNSQYGLDGTRHSTDRYPFQSHLQLSGISKDIQKLNNILKACTNGPLNVSRGSIDIGRELLKGAMDLEESLRMLVTLQEASDHMAGYQGKQFRLLKDEEEDESSSHNANRKKVMNRRRFSFDASSRHTDELLKEDTVTSASEQTTQGLSYPKKSQSRKSNSQSSSDAVMPFISHRRSMSCGPDTKPDTQFSGIMSKNCLSKEISSFSSGNGDSSISKSIKKRESEGTPTRDKVRIPNVVARLMGLEELPPLKAEVNSEMQKVPETLNGTGSKKSSKSLRADSGVSKNEDDVKRHSQKHLPGTGGKNSVPQGKGTREAKATKASSNIPDATYNMIMANSPTPEGTREAKATKASSNIPDATYNMVMANSPSPEGTGEAKATKASSNIPDAMYNMRMANSPSQDNTRNISPASNYSVKYHEKVHEQIDTTVIVHSRKARVANREVTQSRETKDQKEKRCKGKVELITSDVKQPVSENDIFSMTSHSSGYHDDAVTKKNPQIRDQRYAQKDTAIPNNQSNTANHDMSQQKYFGHGLKSKNTVHESASEKEHNEQNKSQSSVSTKSDPKSNNSKRPIYDLSTQKLSSCSKAIVTSKSAAKKTQATEPKEHLKIIYQEKQNTRNKSSTHHEGDRKTASESFKDEKAGKIDPRSNKENATHPILVTERRKPLHDATVQKVDIAQTTENKGESSSISEDKYKNNETPNSKAQTLQEQASLLNELERTWKERVNIAEEIVAMNMKEYLQQKAEPTSHSNSISSDDSIDPNVADERRQALGTNGHNMVDTALSAQQTPPISPNDDLELQPLTLKEKQAEGPTDSRQLSNSHLIKLQKHPVHALDSFRKSEQLLMQILTKDQKFLNTAQALFRVKIPINVHQAAENVCSEKENKLDLDCGYEIMQRKGKKEEVTIAMKMSCAPAKVRCLDSLIQELNDDLESLKILHRANDYDAMESLHHMLERDIQDTNPDVNCMWDFGWNSMILAPVEREEVIQDLERHVLNGLINEIVKDLINTSITDL